MVKENVALMNVLEDKFFWELECVKTVQALQHPMRIIESVSLQDVNLIKYWASMVNVKIAHHTHIHLLSMLEILLKEHKDVKLILVQKDKSC